MTTIHTLLFADDDTSVWGVYWLPAESGSAPLACRAGAAAGLFTGGLNETDPAAPWRFEGDEISLVFIPTEAAGRGGAADSGFESLDQLCEVRGTVALEGGKHEISCMGWRSSLEGSIELSGIDSFRLAGGWFDPADGVALLSLRPRKARGHNDDLLAATALEPGSSPRVDDPRLSTTYDATGLPARVGLELWFESERREEDADDGDRQFPRRAAGEAVGDGIEWEVGDFDMHAVPLRWHSRGTDGSGVYLLGQRE